MPSQAYFGLMLSFQFLLSVPVCSKSEAKASVTHLQSSLPSDLSRNSSEVTMPSLFPFDWMAGFLSHPVASVLISLLCHRRRYFPVAYVSPSAQFPILIEIWDLRLADVSEDDTTIVYVSHLTRTLYLLFVSGWRLS